MGKAGFAINGLAVFFIVLFDVFYCFPYVYPPETSSMNYNSVILVGVVLVTAGWWFGYGRKKYPGPKILGVVLIEGEVAAAAASGGVGMVSGKGEKGDV